MRPPSLVIPRTAAALITLATGCAVSVAPPESRPSAETAGLAGIWRGSFWQPSAGDTGHVHGGIELEVKEDGSYTGIWATRQVAGSTRSSRSESP